MNSVRLTLLDIRELKPQAEEILRSLPEKLQKKALHYRKEDDQLRSIGASLFLLRAAKGHEIHYSPEGKPFVVGENYFNISHSGDYVVLAEADRTIGVDIEKVTDIGLDDGLKHIALTEKEKSWVKDSLLRFYFVWTRKESLIKCEGSGFISEPNEIETLNEPVNYRGNIYCIESFMIDGHVISLTYSHTHKSRFFLPQQHF